MKNIILKLKNKSLPGIHSHRSLVPSNRFQHLNKIKFIEGEKNNFKITDQSDFQNLKNIYKSKQSVGIGFDVHRLVPKRKLYLAGLKIKSPLGTLGHSDGDPVLHSITDAILGACKMGDIGQMFSDKSKKFKNIRSTILQAPRIASVIECNTGSPSE